MKKPIFETKMCKKHGETKFRLTPNDGRFRCVLCTNGYKNNRRNRLKEKYITILGGECVICGYSKCHRSLHFHHLEPEEKSFTIAYLWSNVSDARLEEELKKCILLCSNCHGEVEEGITEITEEHIAEHSVLVSEV